MIHRSATLRPPPRQGRNLGRPQRRRVRPVVGRKAPARRGRR